RRCGLHRGKAPAHRPIPVPSPYKALNEILANARGVPVTDHSDERALVRGEGQETNLADNPALFLVPRSGLDARKTEAVSSPWLLASFTSLTHNILPRIRLVADTHSNSPHTIPRSNG